MLKSITCLLIISAAMSGCATKKAFVVADNKKKGDKKENLPSITTPDVRRIWIPERIDGNRFIEGHYMYVIERGSVWSK